MSICRKKNLRNEGGGIKTEEKGVGVHPACLW